MTFMNTHKIAAGWQLPYECVQPNSPMYVLVKNRQHRIARRKSLTENPSHRLLTPSAKPMDFVKACGRFQTVDKTNAFQSTAFSLLF